MNLMRFKKSKYKVPHVGWGNPSHEDRLEEAVFEISLAEKVKEGTPDISRGQITRLFHSFATHHCWTAQGSHSMNSSSWLLGSPQQR